jgi:hypothetical protein
MSGGVRGGGEVIMSALNIYSNNVKTVPDAKKSKEFLDLLSIYASLNIYDSILSPFQTGEISLNDSNDMIPDYPIAGANILHIAYNVQDGPPETKIDLWFRVVSINNVVINERKQGYTLQLISEEGWKNMHTNLSSSFTGSPTDIIEDIFTQNLSKNGSGKKLMTEGSIGGLKFVCPRWKPSQAITWVTHKALSTDELPGFFFYETMRGFRFLSTTTLMSKNRNLVITDLMSETASERPEGKIKKGYLYKIPGVPVIGSDGKPVSGMVGTETIQNVDDFRILSRQTIGLDTVKGNIASKHITHDIFHKGYSVNSYNYFDDFDKIHRVSKKPHYSYDEVSSDISISMSPKQSRIHSDKKNDVGSRTLYADDYALLRKHILKQIDDEIINNFEVPGHPIIESGRLLEFNYPAIRKVDGPENVYNEKYSGLYLIRDCIHMFKPVANTTTSYKVDLNIVKDGWNA